MLSPFDLPMLSPLFVKEAISRQLTMTMVYISVHLWHTTLIHLRSQLKLVWYSGKNLVWNSFIYIADRTRLLCSVLNTIHNANTLTSESPISKGLLHYRTRQRDWLMFAMYFATIYSYNYTILLWEFQNQVTLAGLLKRKAVNKLSQMKFDRRFRNIR